MAWHRLTLELGHPSVAVCKELVGSREFACWCDWFEMVAEAQEVGRDRPRHAAPGRAATPMRTYRGPDEIKGFFMNLVAATEARNQKH